MTAQRWSLPELSGAATGSNGTPPIDPIHRLDTIAANVAVVLNECRKSLRQSGGALAKDETEETCERMERVQREIAATKTAVTLMQISKKDLEDRVANLEDEVNQLRLALRSSAEQLALLKIRQLFKSIETEIYKFFVPDNVNMLRHFSLNDVRDELRERRNAPEALGKLNQLLAAIRYDDNDSELARRLIKGRDGFGSNTSTATLYQDTNAVAHPSLDNIKDMDSFKALLNEAGAAPTTVYYRRCCSIAEKWLKLREELTTNAARYRL